MRIDGDLFFLGHVLVQSDHFVDETAHVGALAVQLHHPGLGFGHIQEGFKHGHDAIGLLDAIGQGFTERFDL